LGIELSLGDIHKGSTVVIWHEMNLTKVFEQPIEIIFCLATHIFFPMVLAVFFFWACLLADLIAILQGA